MNIMEVEMKGGEKSDDESKEKKASLKKRGVYEDPTRGARSSS